MTQAEHHRLAGEASRLLKSEQDERALAILEKLTETLPDNIGIQSTRAFCLGKLDRFDEAYELIGYLSTLSESPRIQQTIDFLDARKALVLGSTPAILEKKVPSILFPVPNAEGQDSDALGQKLMQVQQKVESEFSALRVREQEAHQQVQLLKKRLADKERSLQTAYAKNVDLEGLLSEVGQDVSDLQFSMFYPQRHQLHVVPKEEVATEEPSQGEDEQREVDRLTEVMRERDETLSAAFRKNADLVKQLASLEDSVGENDSLGEDTAKVQEQLSALQATLEAAQNKIAVHEEDRLVWEREQQHLTQNVMELLDRRQAAEDLLQQRDVRVDELESGISQAKVDLQAVVELAEGYATATNDTASSYAPGTEESLGEVSGELEALRSEKESLRESLEEAQEKWESAQSKVGVLDKRNTQQRNHFRRQRTYFLEATKDKEHLENAFEQVQEKLAQAESRWVSILTRWAISENVRKELTARLLIETQDQSGIGQALQDAESALEKSEAVLKCQEDEIEFLRQGVSDYQASLHEQEQRAETLALEVADTGEASSAWEAREAELLAQLAEESTGSETLRAELERLREERQLVQEQGEAKDVSEQEIRAAHAALQTELSQAEGELAQANRERSEGEIQHLILNEEVEGLRADREMNQTKLHATQEALAAAQTALSGSEEDLASTQVTLTELEEKWSQKSEEHDRLLQSHAALGDADQQLTETRQELLVSEGELAESLLALETLQRKYDELEAQHRVAEDDLRDVRETLAGTETELSALGETLAQLEKAHADLEAKQAATEQELSLNVDEVARLESEQSVLNVRHEQLLENYAGVEQDNAATSEQLAEARTQIEQSNAAQEELRQTHEALLEENAALEGDRDRYVAEGEAQRETIAGLESKVLTLGQAHENLSESTVELRAAKTVVQDELLDARVQLQGLKSDLTELTQSHESLLESNVQTQITERSTREELAATRIHYQETKADLEGLHGTHDTLMDEHEALEVQRDETNQLLATTSGELLETQGALNQTRDELSASHQAHAELSEEQEQLCAAKEAVDETLSATESALGELKDQFETTTRDRDALEEKRAGLDADLEATMGTLNTVLAEKSSVETSLATETEERESLELALAELDRQRADLEEQLETHVESIVVMTQQLDGMSRHLFDEKEALKHSQAEHQQLRGVQAKTHAALTSTHEELKATHQAKSATETNLKQVQAQLNTTQGDVARKKQLLSDQAVLESELRAAMARSSEELATRIEQIATLTETTATLRERVVDLTTDLRVMTQQEAESQATVSQLELQVQGVNESFEESQNNLSNANATIDTHVERIETVERGLKQTRQDLASLQSRYEALSSLSDDREERRVEAATERDRLRTALTTLEEEWDTLRNVELPQALEQKVRALRDMQRLQSEVELLRKQLW